MGKSGFLPVYWTDNRMTQSNAKTLLLLKPRGFCAGVVRAIDIVRIALENFGAPIYVRKEVPHCAFSNSVPAKAVRRNVCIRT